MKDKIIEKVETILMQLERIETKLDNVIKAIHDYDGNDEYGESSFEAFMDTKMEDDMGDSNIQDERVGEKKRSKRRYYKPKNK